MINMDMPQAIPIPSRTPVKVPTTSTSTTPSLQSVLDQKRLSNQTMRLSVSTSTTSSPSSSPSSPTNSLLSFDMLDCGVATHSHPLDDPPLLDYLTDIDNDFFNDTRIREHVEPVETAKETRTIQKRPSLVSQLSQSLRSFTKSTANQNLFDIQPRLTDDRLPKQELHKHLSFQDRELDTFKVTSSAHSPSTSPSSTSSTPSTTTVYRNREARINSQFLRLYSHECCSRQKGLLPEIAPEEEEIYSHNPTLYRGSDREFALIVRQRLWNCVVLPPREDSIMDTPNEEYVYEGDENNETLINTQRVKPWINLDDERNTLRPRGMLGRDTQFTVKGWCNARWMPKNDY